MIDSNINKATIIMPSLITRNRSYNGFLQNCAEGLKITENLLGIWQSSFIIYKN